MVAASQIRRELLESDNNAIMGLLMRYPDVKNVQPILDLAYRMERSASLRVMSNWFVLNHC